MVDIVVPLLKAGMKKNGEVAPVHPIRTNKGFEISEQIKQELLQNGITFDR